MNEETKCQTRAVLLCLGSESSSDSVLRIFIPSTALQLYITVQRDLRGSYSADFFQRAHTVMGKMTKWQDQTKSSSGQTNILTLTQVLDHTFAFNKILFFPSGGSINLRFPGVFKGMLSSLSGYRIDLPCSGLCE